VSEMQAVATLAGGCFWCLEAVFERLRGVESVMPGYTGGQAEHPDYESVCGGKTGHAEAVEIRYDPAQIGYDELLAIFFSIHDPTTLNRQGNDIGTQYRSAIFWHDELQHATAQAMIDELNTAGVWRAPIVTELQRAGRFYPAEPYHRHYFAQHPEQGYCQFVIAPKVEKFSQVFRDKLR